ncbi:Hypothetical predicted protein [Cloeon dipterum]|uniref:RCR-type E3 ubiquitin transferase n=1 Tax=Cloeon dipterum TaxID=197152 RepID=A0A8S1DMR2_9INSE|nr:Hypothetical predicted protein [Cloeon dipterum]
MNEHSHIYQSIERQFLRDLVQCTPGTSGGRLARWLQPESFVEPRRCEVLYSKDDMRCGWPAIVTILSKDQYGHLVNAPNLKIEVKASPIDKGDIGLETTTNGSAAVNRRSRRFSMPDALSFGGHPQPSLEVPYEVTVKEKMHYHSISIMKAYENYSFEELRFMSPTLRRTSENMLVRPNGDGTYSATWTPASTGWYMVLVTVDGYPLEEAYRVEVKDAPQGIAPPTTTVIKKTPNQPSRLRKYVAKFSAGLRIRSHPSLQSEHIGTVGVNGIISFVDEIHNDDGVWVRLGNDSMRQYGISSSYPEAWCLQYNQHLGKTLLVPVEEPKAVSDEGFRKVSVKKTSSNESPLKERKLSAPAPTGGPGFYKVVKCGASGHNIRSRPSMTAPPVGMLVAGNRAMIVADDVNSEGTWVQLDHESKKEFCFNTDGEAWSLAVSKGDVVYLQHELANDCRHDKTPGDHHPFSVPPKKAFDFTAQNRADAFTFAQKEPGSASSAGSMTGNPFVFGSLDSKKPEIAPKPQSVGAGRFSALNKWLRGESTPTIVDTRGSPPVIPPPPGPAVKLVTGMSSKDLPPELMGVSVKDLVKAIGESRANGNGVTPPGTPRRPSRSSSPKAPLPGTATILAHQASSRSSSPVPIPPAGKLDSVASSGGSPKSIGVSPLVSAPGNMTTAESGRRGSTQSDTSALLSSLTRDLSHSPSNSSLQMRSESPNSLHGQLIDQAAGSPKLTQTGTQTSPDGSLKSSLHFNVGDSLGAATAVPVRISPKPVRKERSNSKNVPNASSRSRRANSPKEHHHKSRNRGTSPAHPLAKEPVKEAIAPSVAECLRAVFAAFLWHEGLVHDAMACASFLKFHPGLPKQGALVITRQQNSLSSNLDKVKQRHSVEVSASNYLHIQPSTLETLTRCAANANANRRKKHDSAGAIREEEPTSDAGSTAGAAVTVLPPALRSLVLLWEELSKGCLRTIQRQEVMQSPMTASVVLRRTESGKAAQSSSNQPTSSKEKKEGEKRGRKKKDWRPIGAVVKSQEISGRLPGLPQRETVCELCGGSFPQPITFHMKSCHPGCGESAGGKGYNSGGNFCVGWAGNCGDGGIVGSTWYLICDTCRERYLKQRKQQRKDSLSGHKKSKKKVTSKLLSPMLLQESHVVMKNNAMFLLELASASSRDPPPCSPPLRRSPHGMPSVSEQEDGPFPSLPSGLPGFQCLSTLGVSPAQVRHLAEEHLLAETLRKNGEEGLDRYLEGMESKSVRPVSDCPLSDSEDSLRGRPFHRSISMGTKDWQSGRLVRKRNNSSGEPNEAGSSLLCHPSAALQKLVPFDLSCTLSTTDENNAPRPRCDLMERPVMEFVMQQHNLESLQLAMKQAIRKAACRVYAMQALTWLLRSVTQPTCLHDLLWWFVAALTPASEYSGAIAEQPMDNELGRIGKFEDHELHAVCEHPLSDLAVAGDAVRPLPSAFHSLLQAVADLMLLLPMGSALQQMAVRCWGIKFRHSDHSFLHRSHVFSNISKILSRTEEEEAFDESHHSILSTTTSGPCFVETLRDLTANVEIKASSRQAMVFSLTDFSTETFWESSDEDRNKTKFLMVSCAKNSWPKMVYVHIDNCRDLANKVDVETRYSGWISSIIPENHHSVIRIELRGPDNTLRVRQVRILGDIEGQELSARTTKHHSALSIQQKNCEAETLRVFRLITSQVFGKLIQGVEMEEAAGGEEGASEARENTKGEESNDLREHMVGILFSRSKLTNLQRQVCQHIVQAIRSESSRVKEEWEAFLCSAGSQIQSVAPGEKIVSDTYCFEMLSMMLALSGSTVGRAYLSQQTVLLKDLLSLLHTGSARVQRQVTSLLRRMLPEVPPQHLAAVLGVERLPPADFSIVTASNKNGVAENEFDMHKMGILDVFLSVIAKSLTVQVRVKGGGKETQAKGTSTASLATSIKSAPSQGRWWMRGCNSRKLSEGIISLLKDMAAGKLSEAWADVTKGAVAENILNLTKLPESSRSPQQCLASPTLWLALASLCVLDADHVERLSSGQWSAAEGQPTVPRPTCSNHDDGDTAAIIQCNACGNLCAECDRVLHLHRRTRLHQRQVCKEEEEAIKVDLHEGCGRTKLFWLLALADSSTLKALVEFRERGTRSKAAAAGTVAAGVCRFCGATGSSGLLAIGNVCADHECQEHAKNACSRLHACGHMCGGVQAESPCLPCLHGCSDEPNLKQDADDMCMICFTDALACAPAVQLKCGHVFHMHCCKNALVKRWAGPRITFSFAHCPICKSDVEHPVLNTLLAPIRELYEDVRRKALMRLEYEGLNRAGRTHKDPAAYAMDKYAYYVCFKCKKAYYGGEARCDADAGITEDYDPSELVCGACSDVSRAQMCPKHGTDFLEYKCRYCCSVAVFFCFGTTHFCNACHDDFQRVTNLPKHELPHCPAGPRAKQLEGEECPLHIKHPATGEEFALGCGVCRNAHTF